MAESQQPIKYVKGLQGQLLIEDPSIVTPDNERTFEGGSGKMYLDISSQTYKTTIADIRAAGTLNPNIVYKTMDFGVPGDWQVDEADTVSSDNTGTILVTSGGQRLKRKYSGYIDVKWFGAKGDGSTDDSTAIQLSINSVSGTGGTIYFQEGTFIVSSTIDIKSNIYLKGSGVGSVISCSGCSVRVSGIIQGAHVTNWGISDISIKRTGTAGPALDMDGDGTMGQNKGVIRFTIINLNIISSSGDGIRMRDVFIGNIYNPIIRNCVGYGLLIEKDSVAGNVGANTVSIHGGEIQQNNIGIKTEYVSGLGIFGTAIEGNNSGGVAIAENTRNLCFYNSYFELNGSAASERDVIIGDSGISSQAIKFDNCVFWNGAAASKNYAIEITKGVTIQINNCVFNTYSTAGIYVNPTGGGAVRGYYTNCLANNTTLSSGDNNYFFELKPILSKQIELSSTTVDLANGTDFYRDISSNTSLSLSREYDGVKASIMITNTDSSPHTISVSNVDFPKNSENEIPPGGKAYISLSQINSEMNASIVIYDAPTT